MLITSLSRKRTFRMYELNSIMLTALTPSVDLGGVGVDLDSVVRTSERRLNLRSKEFALERVGGDVGISLGDPSRKLPPTIGVAVDAVYKGGSEAIRR